MRIDSREEGGTGPPDKLKECTVNVAQYLQTEVPSALQPSSSIDFGLPSSSSSYPSGETCLSKSISSSMDMKNHAPPSSLPSLPSETQPSMDIQNKIPAKNEDPVIKDLAVDLSGQNSVDVDRIRLPSTREDVPSSECNTQTTTTRKTSSSSDQEESPAILGRDESVESRVKSSLEDTSTTNGPSSSNGHNNASSDKEDVTGSHTQCTDQYFLSTSSHLHLNHVDSSSSEAIKPDVDSLQDRQALLSCNKLTNHRQDHNEDSSCRQDIQDQTATSAVNFIMGNNNSLISLEDTSRSATSLQDTPEGFKESVTLTGNLINQTTPEFKRSPSEDAVTRRSNCVQDSIRKSCSTGEPRETSNNIVKTMLSEMRHQEESSRVNCHESSVVAVPDSVSRLLNPLPSLKVTDESSQDQHLTLNGTHRPSRESSYEPMDSFTVVSGSSSSSGDLDLLDPVHKRLRDESNSVASGDHNYISVSDENSLQANDDGQGMMFTDEDFRESLKRHSDLNNSPKPNAKKRSASGEVTSSRQQLIKTHNDPQGTVSPSKNNKNRRKAKASPKNDSNNQMLKSVNGPEMVKSSLIQIGSFVDASQSFRLDSELIPGTEHVMTIETVVGTQGKVTKVRQRKTNCKSNPETGNNNNNVPSSEKKRKRKST